MTLSQQQTQPANSIFQLKKMRAFIKMGKISTRMTISVSDVRWVVERADPSAPWTAMSNSSIAGQRVTGVFNNTYSLFTFKIFIRMYCIFFLPCDVRQEHWSCLLSRLSGLKNTTIPSLRTVQHLDIIWYICFLNIGWWISITRKKAEEKCSRSTL